MKIKILKVYELNDILRIETECEFGKDNLGLGLHTKFLNPATGKPRFLDEVKELLRKKYEKKLATKKNAFTKYWNTTINTEK